MSLSVSDRTSLDRSSTPTQNEYSLRNPPLFLSSVSNTPMNQSEVLLDDLIVSSTIKEEVLSLLNSTSSEGKIKGGKGFTKKLFNWKGINKDKKSNASGSSSGGLPMRQISAPIPISSPISIFTTTTSLPLGFPSPPSSVPDLTSSRQFIPPSQRVRNNFTSAQHHPTAFIAPHLVHPGSQSLSSMSSMTSTSSFNTTYATDEWDSSSEVTTLSTDADNSLDDRMWRVKGLEEEITSVEDDEVLQGGGDRNSTPVPRDRPTSRLSVSTPPRAKRYSASSTISHSSPPFDLEYEKAAKALRNSSSSSSPAPELSRAEGDNEDADDEISPPKKFKARKNFDHLFASSSSDDYTSRVRIPSIRFEGISMDAVFAQVERQMRGEEEPVDLTKQVIPLGLGYSIPATEFNRKPLLVDTATAPIVQLSSSNQIESPAPSPTDSKSSRSSVDSTSSAHTAREASSIAMGQSFSLPITSSNAPIMIQPVAYARRLSSRPTPVNVLAANAISSRNPNNYSPRRYHSAPTVPLVVLRPTHSPILAGAFSSPLSSTSTKMTYSPASYSSNSPFTADTYTPSPTISTPSTFKDTVSGVSPALTPRSPTTPDHEFWDPTLTFNRDSRPSSSCSTATKVVVLEKGKAVKKMSSRAPAFRKSSLEVRKLSLTSSTTDEAVTLSPSSSTSSTPPVSPATSSHSNLSTPNLDSPTIARFSSPSMMTPSAATSYAVKQAEEADKVLRMLLHLNSPPNPVPSDQPQTFSLTSGALQLHNSPRYKENKNRGMPSSPSLTFNTSKVMVDRTATVYESDDVGQFGDAPHHLTVAKQPTVIVPTLTLSSASTSNIGTSSDGSKRPPVPHRADQIHAFLMEQQRDLSVLPTSKVLLTLTPSSSTSSSSPSMKSYKSHKKQTVMKNSIDSIKSFDSLTSLTSSISYSAAVATRRGGHSRIGSGSSMASTRGGSSGNINGGLIGRRGIGLVRSASSMMSLNESLGDSEEYDSVEGHEAAIVMSVERVTYDSAVGVAM